MTTEDTADDTADGTAVDTADGTADDTADGTAVDTADDTAKDTTTKPPERLDDPATIDLDGLREEIGSIDREIVELIAQRTYVAETIARVKRERDLPTTDEQQETRVMERAGENAERFDVDSNLVKAVFRLLIELNKVEQRESR